MLYLFLMSLISGSEETFEGSEAPRTSQEAPKEAREDVLGEKTGLQRGRPADTKHRNSKKKASIGENVAHMTHIGPKLAKMDRRWPPQPFVFHFFFRRACMEKRGNNYARDFFKPRWYFYRFLMSLFLGPEETLEGRRLWRAGGDFEGSHEVRQRSRGHSTSCVHFYCIPALVACISIVFLSQSEVSNNFV